MLELLETALGHAFKGRFDVILPLPRTTGNSTPVLPNHQILRQITIQIINRIQGWILREETFPALLHNSKIHIMQVSHNITNAKSAEAILHDRMSSLDHEEVWAVFLDLRASVIDKKMLSMGTLSQTSIDCRTVLRNALLVNAASLILLHNHPSGDPRPSVHDIHFTERLKKACDFLDVRLLDHIIIGDKGYFSFADETINLF